MQIAPSLGHCSIITPLLSMQRLYCIYKQGFTANQQDVNGYIVVCIMKFILYR